MKLVATIPLRNEGYVCGLSLRVALLWCDSIIVLMHECEDETSEIVEQVIREHDRGRVLVLREHGPWDEMIHRQRMLEYARAKNATHIAIVDADEVMSGNLLTWIRGVDVAMGAEVCAPGQILQLPGYNLRNGLEFYHANGIWGRRWFSLAFKDDPALSWDGDKFHAREPGGKVLVPFQPVAQGQGGVLHLWGASERRLKAKSALYKLVERVRWPDKQVDAIDRMYSWSIHGAPDHPSFGTPKTWTYADVPRSWWEPYSHLMKYLDIDREPWQEAEARRLVAKHGVEITKGLDLFGVI